MAYTINMPQANQRINDTQPLIRDNFNEINTRFAINHVGFNIAGAGKHALVQFVTQVPGAVPAVATTEIGIYNKVPEAPFPLTGFQELFIKLNNGIGHALDVPITAKVLTGGFGTISWFYLPCGLIIKYGQANTFASGALTVTLNGVPLNTWGPDYTQVPFVLLTPRGNVGQNTFVHYRATGAVDSFSVEGGTNNVVNAMAFNWLSIGI